MQHINQGFPNSVKGRGKPHLNGGNGKFFWGIFLSGGGNLTRSDFDHLNLFQSYKQHFVNIENRLKSKLQRTKLNVKRL